jgi:hypothetical protein
VKLGEVTTILTLLRYTWETWMPTTRSPSYYYTHCPCHSGEPYRGFFILKHCAS